MVYVLSLPLVLFAVCFYKLGMNPAATICWLISGILFFTGFKLKRLALSLSSLLVGVASLAFMLVNYNLCAISAQNYCTMAQVDDLQKTQWEQLKNGSRKTLDDIKWKDLPR